MYGVNRSKHGINMKQNAVYVMKRATDVSTKSSLTESGRNPNEYDYVGTE